MAYGQNAPSCDSLSFLRRVFYDIFSVYVVLCFEKVLSVNAHIRLFFTVIFQRKRLFNDSLDSQIHLLVLSQWHIFYILILLQKFKK